MTTLPPRRAKRAERRNDERVPTDAPARIVAGPATIEGQVENIGPNGAGFATRQMEPPLEIGARVTLSVTGADDSGADLVLEGRIVRAEEFSDGDGDTRSYGIAFDSPVDA